MNSYNFQRRLNETSGYESTIEQNVRITLETDLGGPFWVRLRRCDSVIYQEGHSSPKRARDRFEAVVENHVENRPLNQ